VQTVSERADSIILSDSLEALRGMPGGAYRLVYIDPPFNTGKTQRRVTLQVRESKGGSRGGFGGRRYDTREVGVESYGDSHEDYIGFLRPRLQEARRVLTEDGSLFFHIDPRESHYCKVLLDDVFGRESYMNEIIWAYDFGGRPLRRWPAKHDVIFWYAKDPENYVFNTDAMDRIPYMAPGLAGPEKAARGKTPTDVWWQTIVPTSGREKTGYPTQKPVQILERIIRVHSDPGDAILDFFAGSGTTGEAAHRLDRAFTLVDSNPAAVAIMSRRLAAAQPSISTPKLEPLSPA
jgi:site-specific DNA-methyltransferase (adenine-specific)